MSKAQHTPGPWYVGGDGTIVYAADGFAAANASVFRGGKDAAMKSARLIAAAPETAAERDRLKEEKAELLKALEAIIRADDLQELTSEEINAGAAIAKAKGK